MSIRIALYDLQEQLPDVLDRVANGGEEFIIERNGKDSAVLVSTRAWQRRSVSKQLDARGSNYRLSREKQLRAEELLSHKERGSLSRAQHRDLNELLCESDEIMLRRAEAIDSGA